MKDNLEEKKYLSIKAFFNVMAFFPLAFFLTLISGVITFTILYVTTSKLLFLIILISYSVVVTSSYLIFAFHSMKRFGAVFVRGLYGTTVYNLRNIAENNNALIEYANTQYHEFVLLNEQIDILKKELNHATLISGANSLADIQLDYIDVDNRVITFYSLKSNLENIIFASQNYRNVLVELYYDLGEDALANREIDYLLLLLRKEFETYPDVLFAVQEKKSIYVYLPRIDTLSKIKEHLEMCLKNATIAKRTAEGLSTIPANFALVCYPFSDVHEIFSDLAYARRQGEAINIFLPDRLNSYQENKILKNSMNLNVMTKLISPLLNLNTSLEDSKKNRREVERVLKLVRNHFVLDYTGIIGYDDVKRSYRFTFQDNDKDTPALSSDDYIEKEFVLTMNKVKDDNGSYYFAFRSHANSDLGRHLDRVGLESGFFYVINEGETPIGAIYFFNKNKEFNIDSYIQEALLMLCNRVSSILLTQRRDQEVSNSYQEIDSLLKLSDYSTYRVANESHDLLKASSTMHNLFPHLELGEKCYKALYGLDKPCHDCPLFTGHKKMSHLKGSNFETSLVLEDRRLPYHIMTLKNLHEDESEERYHPELLINSYPTLVQALVNCYTINGKGYLLLLRIDNHADLITSHGAEAYLSILRDFINDLKASHNALENIYFFNEQTLALLFTEYGQTDIINECEKIFDITKGQTVEERLSFTYLPVSYPRSFPTASDFLRQAEIFATRGKYEINKNFIYFDESSYNRSADKNEFMLAVIESTFNNKTFSVNLQPMVDARTKRIFGAELLLRITDEYRNMVFRTDQLVNVAAKHDKIGIISNALLEYIGGLYRQYSITVFNVLGFERLSLNTDYSFFTDKNFYKDTNAFINSLRLPRNFLAFEIPENDIANHLHEFKEITKQLNNLHIAIVADQYTGRYVSLEELKSIGFNEVKISRNIINHIDSDRQRLNDVKQLLLSIKNLGMKASVVGVENVDQYQLLKDINDDALMQGYYFFRPLEKQALIEAVRATNVTKNKNSD